MESEVLKAQDFLEKKNQKKAKIAIVLGSGLGSFIDHVDKKEAIPYSEIPFFPRSTVPGHQGQFLFASVGGIPLYVLQGRVHYYEGKSLAEVTFTTRVLPGRSTDCSHPFWSAKMQFGRGCGSLDRR